MTPRCVYLLIAVFLAGCVRQYSAARLDPETAAFKGVASYLADAPAVKVIFVHGMCTHDPAEWIDRRWDAHIRDALAAALSEQSGRPDPAAALQPAYYIEKRTYAIGDKRLDARFVMWSGATAQDKKRLAFDAPPPTGEFNWRRARVNASLKTDLVNDCLSDPVIYAGNRHEELRDMMKGAICQALDLGTDAETGGCGATASAAATPVLIVTESLGSKIVFDAVLDLAATANSQSFEQALAAVPQIYMLANQLPLLELARVPAPQPIAMSDRSLVEESGDTAVRVTRFLVKSRGAHPALAAPAGLEADGAQVSLVAFTDPNDLLSYRLPTRGWPEGVTVSNVLDSNAGALLGFIVEDPRQAHSGYSANAEVMSLVLCGSSREDCRALRRTTQ